MEVKTCLNGVGLFATESFSIGSKMHLLSGQEYNKPSQTTIEIGLDRHIDDKIFGIYMNHSFQPSCKIMDGYIVAIIEIIPGTELTFNYNDNESCMSAPFIDTATQIIVSGKYS